MKLSKAMAIVSLALILPLTLPSCQSDGDDGATNSTGAPVGEEMASGGPTEGGEVPVVQNRQDRVDALIKKADAAANAGQTERAKDLYNEVLSHDPDNEEAGRRYGEMIALLSNGTGAGVQDDVARQIGRNQAAQVKAQAFLQNAVQHRLDGNLDESIVELTKAHQLLKFSPSSGDLTADYVKRILDETRAMRDTRERETEMRRQEEIATMKRKEDDRERKRLERRVRNLWDSALSKFESEQFERSENIADEILRLNYADPNARRLKESARRARHSLAKQRNIRDYRREWARTLQELKSATIPITGVVQFPDIDTWTKISDRGAIQISRSRIAEESEADRQVRGRLASTMLPRVDWNGKTLDDVVGELRAQVGVNIFVTPGARDAADGVGELEVEFTNVTAENALSVACSTLEVAYSVSDGILKIQTPEEARSNKVIEFYDVRDLVSPINSFPGVQLNINASGTTLADVEPEEIEPTQSIEIDRLVDLIKNAVDPAWDEDEGNRLDPKNGTLIVRQTPEKQRLVRNLLSDLRKNTGLQVSIEARFITVENNFLQEIGVDLRGLGDDSGGLGQAGVGVDRPFDDYGVVGTGVGTAQSPVGIGSDSSAGVFFSDDNGNTDGRIRTENLFDEMLGNPNVLDGSGGIAFQFAYLDDTQLEAILRAVQKYERINTLTAPKIMVHNTQRANLTLLNEVSYVKDFDVEIAQAAVVADPVVDKIREGVVLDVRPIVSHDRRFVTIELRPNVATLVRPIRNFTTSLGVGAPVTFQLPELHKEAVNTTVVVPDGGTLLLGGLKFAEERSLESGVPILSDIPILSFFFSRTGKYTNLKDLVILLKVEIVILDEREPGLAATN